MVAGRDALHVAAVALAHRTLSSWAVLRAAHHAAYLRRGVRAHAATADRASEARVDTEAGVDVAGGEFFGAPSAGLGTQFCYVDPARSTAKSLAAAVL